MSEESWPTLQPGDYVGPYRLLKPLGEGSTGAVWEAEDITLRRHVAIKLLDPGHAENPEMQKRFAREARLLSLFAYDGMPAVFAFGEEDGVFYFTMTHVVGKTGTDLLAEATPMSFLQAAHMLEKLLGILSTLHQRGIVHRDIKPEHLLLDGSRLWLIDFGCAKPMDEADPGLSTSLGAAGEGLTIYGRVLGTPGYIAPEVDAGHPATAQADIFAAGVCAMDFMLARRWIALDTPAVRKQKINHGPSQVLKRLGLSSGQSRFIERLVAGDPTNRPASAQDALEELRYLLRPKPLLPQPAPSLQRAPKRLPYASATLFAMLGLSGALLLMAYQLPTGLANAGKTRHHTIHLSIPKKVNPGDTIVFEGPLRAVSVSPLGWEFTLNGLPCRVLLPNLVLREYLHVSLTAQVLRQNGVLAELDPNATKITFTPTGR